MFEETFIQFYSTDDNINLTECPILVSEEELPGVKAAGTNLAHDFGRVFDTGQPKTIISPKSIAQDSAIPTAIIVGSLETSGLIQDLAKSGKIDTQDLRGKWESFQTNVVANPIEGVQEALVIAGSDKRGTIYGIYTLSEQIGVSPWHWWADVPPKHHAAIYASKKTTHHGPPSIRYRGIFLNDEAPALTGWVLEKFGKYNSQFYEKVFELLLRLKANFIWPAMWPGYPNPGASFFTDDPRNQQLADELGIVVSTSHHEPMQRLSNEWFAENPEGSWNWLTNKDRITEFFREGVQRAAGYESYFTLGMRGEYDKKMKGDDPVAVVRDVIQTQRRLIEERHGAADAVPQVLACYKEVQAIYESGKLDVPDDVTLLFGDDNFGTIRRLPTQLERDRKGGAGIYYHLEYVGWPRSYKWINSNSLGKMKHQLMQAYHHQARQIWVFNVGDLKPLECPLSFAMALAWDCEAVDTQPFLSNWANQNFSTETANEAAELLSGYDRIASIRKHELIEPTTFSLLHYREAETLLHRLNHLLQKATSLHQNTPPPSQPATFQLLLHPIKATQIYTTLQILRSKNRLYARQRRTSTNTLAAKIFSLFTSDFDLSEEYHTLLSGKWNQILRQPHYGYENETWHAPSRDMIDGIAYVQQRQSSNPVVGDMGVAIEGHEGVRAGRCNEESDRTFPSRRDLVAGLTFQTKVSRYSVGKRWFEIFSRGPGEVNWSVGVGQEWMKVSRYGGVLVPGGEEEDVRIEISVDWELVPEGFDEEVLIDVRSEEGGFEQVHLPVSGHRLPKGGFAACHVEAEGYISVPAPCCEEVSWPYQILPCTGRLETGSIALDSSCTSPIAIPFLRYPIYIFSSSPPTRTPIPLILYFGTTLNLSPSSSRETLQYDIQIDTHPIITHDLYAISPSSIENSVNEGWPAADGWFEAAKDNVWVKKHEVSRDVLTQGRHEIKIRLRKSNMLLEKIVVDLGGVRESLLGPPESFRFGGRGSQMSESYRDTSLYNNLM